MNRLVCQCNVNARMNEHCQILTDFQNYCTAGKRMNLLQNPFNNTCLTLGMLLHYLGNLKIQIFCRYSAHVEENANIWQFKCTEFYSSTHVIEMDRMSDYDIRPKPKVWTGSPNECRTFGRTSAECCMLG